RKINVVVGDHAFRRHFRVKHAVLDDAFVAQDVVEVVADVAFGHDQADVPDVLEVFGRKALGPVERDVAALDYHVLSVLDGGLDHLAQDRPQVGREQVVVLGRQIGAAAADQPHFQVVDRKIRVFVFFEQALRKRGFAGVRSAAEQQDHGGPSFSVGFLHYS